MAFFFAPIKLMCTQCRLEVTSIAISPLSMFKTDPYISLCSRLGSIFAYLRLGG